MAPASFAAACWLTAMLCVSGCAPMPRAGDAAATAARGVAREAADRAATAAAAGTFIDTHAEFGRAYASLTVRRVADWAVQTADPRGLAFVIVDKPAARVYVFDAGGRLKGAAPALLGLARGDESVPGIGERAIADILPAERTTPAGRFVAEPGVNLQHEDIVWVDYDAAVSMHRVRANVAAERRLQRLASPDTVDNRISYGCINLPVAFYDSVLRPAFDGAGKAIVYVLPDTRPVTDFFAIGNPAGGRVAGTRMPGAMPGAVTAR